MNQRFKKVLEYIEGKINKITIANDAHRILKEDAFEIATQRLALSYVEEWESSKPEEKDRREVLKIKRDVLDEVLWSLNNLIHEAEIQKQEEESDARDRETKRRGN